MRKRQKVQISSRRLRWIAGRQIIAAKKRAANSWLRTFISWITKDGDTSCGQNVSGGCRTWPRRLLAFAVSSGHLVIYDSDNHFYPIQTAGFILLCHRVFSSLAFRSRGYCTASHHKGTRLQVHSSCMPILAAATKSPEWP